MRPIKRQREKGNRKERKKRRGRKADRKGEQRNRERKELPGATSSSSSSTFYRFVRARKRVLTPHARETPNTHAGKHARTHARTHSPLRGKQKARGARGILISSCSLIFFPSLRTSPAVPRPDSATREGESFWSRDRRILLLLE